MNLRLDWCSHEAAKYACEHWHYSKTLPLPPLAKIGVWENNIFIGAIIFGHGTNNNLAKPYSLKYEEVTELQRVALNKHDTPVSRIVSIAIKLIKKQYVKLKLIISFADANEGHLGIIYQAGGWIYSGIAKSTPKYKTPDGKILHQRQVNKKGFNKEFGNLRKCFKPEQCVVIKQLNKYRYLYPINDEIKNQILLLAKPYPKKNNADEPKLETGGASSAETGGSNPTRPL